MGNTENGSSGSGFLAGLLLGGAVGAALALLYAPAVGTEMRGTLKQKTDEYSDLARGKAAELGETARIKATEFSDKAGSVAESVKARSNEIADSVMAKTTQVTDSVKAKVTDVAGTVTSAATDLSNRAADKASSMSEAAQDAMNKTHSFVDNQSNAVQEGVKAGKKEYSERSRDLNSQVENNGENHAESDATV